VRRALSFLTIAVVLAYPLVIWFWQGQFEPRYLALLLSLVVLLRLWAVQSDPNRLWWIGGTLFVFALVSWTNAPLPLKLYPVLVNAGLLAVFVYSLAVPPTMIERIARVRDPDLPVAAVSYTRRVTQIWCVFFAVNGIIALLTALWMPVVVWTLYNGVIAYVLMGFLFAGEYCVRWCFKRRHHV
jgi:uncharacterized membrane protein